MPPGGAAPALRPACYSRRAASIELKSATLLAPCRRTSEIRVGDGLSVQRGRPRCARLVGRSYLSAEQQHRSSQISTNGPLQAPQRKTPGLAHGRHHGVYIRKSAGGARSIGFTEIVLKSQVAVRRLDF